MRKRISQIIVNDDVLCDASNLTRGTFWPLDGFLKKADFISVVEKMRLTNGTVWPLPIILDIDDNDLAKIGEANEIILVDKFSRPRAQVSEIEIYEYDKNNYAQKVFGTVDINHPGVAHIFARKKYLIGGQVKCLGLGGGPGGIFAKYDFSPAATKKIFLKKGWKKVVAFQTRNIPHRSHEYLQKKALQKVDGLFIQPVIGPKKAGDFKDELIIETYEVLLSRYYPPGKYFFGILPLKMSYAGPREAVAHALIRRNYGCTHIIIGRDHAGVGSYYSPYAAQEIFDNFTFEDLGIKILKFDDVSFCSHCGRLAEIGECAHEKISLSGTKIRELVKNNQLLPEEFIRKEISEIILNNPNPFV